MTDMVRRLLAVAMVALAVVGLMPLLSQVFGFHSAMVTNSTAGSYYPSTYYTTPPPNLDTPFVSCLQAPQPNTVSSNGNRTGNYFKCTNNWGTAVTISWSTVFGAGTASGILVTGSTVSIPAGAVGTCVQARIFSNSASAGTVRIRGTINQADLNAVIELAANFTIGSNPSACV